MAEKKISLWKVSYVHKKKTVDENNFPKNYIENMWLFRGFCCSSRPQSEKIDKYLDLARELKNQLWNVSDSDTNCSWCTWNGSQGLGEETVRIGNQRKNQCNIFIGPKIYDQDTYT